MEGDQDDQQVESKEWQGACLKWAHLKPVIHLFLVLQVTAKSSVEELVKTLLRVAHTDLEKVRAIWTWICHHIGKHTCSVMWLWNLEPAYVSCGWYRKAVGLENLHDKEN